jgi:hypothetical protein
MKTPEDEAFEDIERRQGGGFPAKRQAAMDKSWLIADLEHAIYLQKRQAMAADKLQEPVLDLDGHVVGKVRKPKPAQEQNTITFSTSADWVMRITADRRIEVNEGVKVTEAAKKVLEAMQWMLKPAQEPVAWPKATPEEQIIGWTLDYKFLESLSDTADGRPSMETVESVLLLAVRQVQSVAPPQPAQEPFGWYSAQEDEFMTDKIRKEHERLNSYTHINGKFDLPLYTHLPKREWVGLTEEETLGFTSQEMTVVKYVSKVLQEKNNGT